MTKKNTSNGNKKAGVGKVVTGLVVGSVIGATVGLLIAPASGEETIRKIKSEAKGIQKNAKKAVGNLEDKARGLVKDVNVVKEDITDSIEDHVTSRKKNSSR